MYDFRSCYVSRCLWLGVEPEVVIKNVLCALTATLDVKNISLLFLDFYLQFLCTDTIVDFMMD